MRSSRHGQRTVRVFRKSVVGACLTICLGLCRPAAAGPYALLAAASGAVAQAPYGTIKGRLVWGYDTVPPPKVLEEKGKAAKDADYCALNQPILSHELEVDPKTKGIAYGFAYIVRPKGANPDAVRELLSSKPKVEIDQKNCDFLPHSVAIHQDQALVLKSSDPKTHNVRVTGFNNGINKTVAPMGELQEKLTRESRPIKVMCDIHPWMGANLLVLDHPFFAVTAADGSFEIKGVPAGDQNLLVWQEKVGYVTPNAGRGMPVKIEPGAVLDVGEIKLLLKADAATAK